jgi:predicted PurR-regulated permease PerM
MRTPHGRPNDVNPLHESTTTNEESPRQLAARANIVFAFAVLIALLIAYKLLHVLEVVYVSALFAVVLTPVIERIMLLRIRGKKISRPLAIGALLLTAAILLAAFLMIGLPPVMRDIRQFSVDLPQRVPEAVAKIKHLPMADKFGVDKLAQNVQGIAGKAAAYIFASFPDWITRVFDLLTAFVLCIYFMLEGDSAYKYFLALFRPPARARLNATLLVAEHRMSKWLLGQGALMVILGAASTIMFAILHVRYYFLLGVLMGLFNIVPVAGGVITILLAGGVAALDSWSKMAGVFIFYAVYLQIENGFLTPRIMKTSVDLMGLSVIISLLIGTALAGVTGALVAVPTAALVAVLADEYLVQKDAEAKRFADEYKAPAADA